jgi:hypothetical protein
MPARRRLLLVAVVSTAVVLVVGLTAWLLWPRTAITRENAARIQVGMTVAEVEEILGGPARDETPKRPLVVKIQNVHPDREWNSDQVSIWLHLDAEGRVRECRAIPVPPKAPLNRLRRWLGL